MGYTEPHPYDDLGGVDVARKLLIIARTLGNKVELTDIRLDPIVPQDLYDEDVDTFLENCKALDEIYEMRRQTALKDGKVLRYVAQYSGQGEMVVGIQEVDIHGPLGTLGGTHNIAIMQTDSYASPYPHIIQSRGAGLEVTAYSLLAQILRACQRMASE